MQGQWFTIWRLTISMIWVYHWKQSDMIPNLTFTKYGNCNALNGFENLDGIKKFSFWYFKPDMILGKLTF